jgi:release factor glutamine methyltransferase
MSAPAISRIRDRRPAPEDPLVLERVVLYGDTAFHVDAGVHPPDDYSALLARHLQVRPGETALDLTTGTGFHAILLARQGCAVVAVDMNPQAVALTERNAELNEVGALVDARAGDLYEACRPGDRFDHLVCWPPLMPTPPERQRNDWLGLANSGGPDGRSVFNRILAGARAHMADDARLWFLHPWYLDRAVTQAQAEAAGLRLETITTAHFAMGWLAFERLPYLRELGFEPVLVDGQPMQEIAVMVASVRQ